MAAKPTRPAARAATAECPPPPLVELVGGPHCGEQVALTEEGGVIRTHAYDGRHYVYHLDPAQPKKCVHKGRWLAP